MGCLILYLLMNFFLLYGNPNLRILELFAYRIQKFGLWKLVCFATDKESGILPESGIPSLESSRLLHRLGIFHVVRLPTLQSTVFF